MHTAAVRRAHRAPRGRLERSDRLAHAARTGRHRLTRHVSVPGGESPRIATYRHISLTRHVSVPGGESLSTHYDHSLLCLGELLITHYAGDEQTRGPRLGELLITNCYVSANYRGVAYPPDAGAPR